MVQSEQLVIYRLLNLSMQLVSYPRGGGGGGGVGADVDNVFIVHIPACPSET